jgi:16S rRNA (guanine(1405)-N(7))-methyltransferase
MKNDKLERLANTVLASAKYKNVCPDFVRSIGSSELAKRRNLKEAIKSTKAKLHQVGGAYLDSKINYAAWLDELRRASQSKNRDDFLKACARILSHHSSTKERLPILDQFYTTILADLPQIQTVLDLACGLNPLSIPWMPLAANVEYYAYDIYQDMIDFLNEFMALSNTKGQAELCDVIQACPPRQADLAFILKALPCLEQVDKSASLRLLDTIKADYVLVSFPVHSLAGKNKGMAVNYEARFRELVGHNDWEIKRFEFATELAFLVTK